MIDITNNHRRKSQEHPLDIATWTSLTGAHDHLAERIGQAIRYPPDVSVFGSLSPVADESAWTDLAQLVGPEGQVALLNSQLSTPADWKVIWQGNGVQMVDVHVEPANDREAIVLETSDVPEMLKLVERAQPGPFRPRTIELGTYLGIRREGALVAMAGVRLHPTGWNEISAVCTEEAYRGQGLATRLVRTVVANIRARGEQPFLHASAHNTNAIRLYETLGFEVRREANFLLLSPPN